VRELDGPRRPVRSEVDAARKKEKKLGKMLKQNVGTFSKMLTNIMTKMLVNYF
jgi:hypothetical protein